ncbi:MAG: hypothetical protein HOP34_13485 [Methylococcaceae bacterium]|nr:hypothetical protein [Methylococcaceae bacterium]
MKEIMFKTLGSLAYAEGALLGWSDELLKFYSSGYRCPQCNERLLGSLGNLTLDYYAANMEKFPLWKLAPFRAEFVGCPKCQYVWKAKANSPATVPAKLAQLHVTETDRVEESLGTDQRLIDNSMSSVSIKRKFTVSKQWTKTYAIDYEKVRAESSGFTLGIDETSFKAGIEESIRKQFSISEEINEVYAEEVEIEVPGFTKLMMLFHWKRIWQCGYIQLSNLHGEDVHLPFRVAVGVTFDQLQVDEK